MERCHHVSPPTVVFQLWFNIWTAIPIHVNHPLNLQHHADTRISSLTGLLSFMLSDEMTTGSLTSPESHKRAFAARSHGWNITQPKFKEAFPEVSNLLKKIEHYIAYLHLPVLHPSNA